MASLLTTLLSVKSGLKARVDRLYKKHPVLIKRVNITQRRLRLKIFASFSITISKDSGAYQNPMFVAEQCSTNTLLLSYIPSKGNLISGEILNTTCFLKEFWHLRNKTFLRVEDIILVQRQLYGSLSD